MKRILILVSLSLFLCSTASAQGGGGESTKKPAKTTKAKPKSPPTPASKPPDVNSPTSGPTSPPTSPSPARTAFGELRWHVPEGWVTEEPSSAMRAAQYKLPKADGDSEDASLVLYFFGATQGGSAQVNIDRWISQMQQPDGSSSKDKAKTDTMTVNGLKLSLVDVTGTYTAEMAPGSGTLHNDTNYRLRAAVVETPKGNYFLKLVGPAKTMAQWHQAFGDYVHSFEFK